MNDSEHDQGPRDPGDPGTAPTAVIDQPSRPKRLLRSRDDRMLAGVAGGLGRYFEVDPVIFRIGFAVSVFFGGLGALAYLALALFVPSDPKPGEDEALAPAQRSRWLGVAAGVAVVVIALSAAGSLLFWGDWGWGDGGGLWGLLVLAAIGAGAYAVLRDREPGEPMTTGRRVAAAALVIVGLIGAAILAVVSAYTAATGSGAVIAAVVIAIGAMLAIAAFWGGARWLIVPALALAIPLGAVSAADISFAGGIGERYHRPASALELDDRYELGVGRLVVDLRELDWRSATERELELDLGVGEAVVLVPEAVCVAPDLHVGAGELALGSEPIDGVDLDERSTSTGDPAAPTLALSGEVDLGTLRVLNDEGDWNGHGRFGRFDGRSEDRAAVC